MVRDEEDLEENHQDRGARKGDGLGDPQENCRQEDSKHSGPRGVEAGKLDEQTGDDRYQCAHSSKHLEGTQALLGRSKVGRSGRHVLRGAWVNRYRCSTAVAAYHGQTSLSSRNEYA